MNLYEQYENSKTWGDIYDKIKVDVKGRTPNQKKFITELRNKEFVICSGFPKSNTIPRSPAPII